MELSSSVLIVNHPHPQLVEFGSDFCSSYEAALELLRNRRHHVIVFKIEAPIDRTLEFIKTLQREFKHIQKIVVKENVSPEHLKYIVNTAGVFRFLENFQDPKFDRSVLEAIEESNLITQNEELLSLVQEQNRTLKQLTLDLEERVEKRQKSLKESSRRLMHTQERFTALHSALLAVYQSSSVAEIETSLTLALRNTLQLSWVRLIFFNSHTPLVSLDLHSPSTIYKSTLYSGKQKIGEALYARDHSAEFTKDESQLLDQITEALSLSIARNATLDKSESFKQQWESTFDAISEPLSLVDESYTLIRTNRSFSDYSREPIDSMIGKKCYEVLFKRSQPCEHCQLGRNSSIKPYFVHPEKIFEVTSQSIKFTSNDRKIYLQIYHDVSEQSQLERKLLETSKMAELGTIGSSIAHELNNPLGGILNFLQLIKMGLKGDESYFEDIVEMEKGALRSRDIVQNLLGFARRSDMNQSVRLNIIEPLEQALSITDLQSRAQSVRVVLDLKTPTVHLNAKFNSLAQVFLNIIQMMKSRIPNLKERKAGESPLIKIQVNDLGGIGLVLFKLEAQSLNELRESNENLDLSWAVTKKLCEEFDIACSRNTSQTVYQLEFKSLEQNSSPNF